MFAFNRRTRVFICKEPTHMRASYDSLFEKVRKVLLQDPLSGHLFVFINLRGTACKCLYYDGTGLVIIGKRMEERRKFCRVNPRFGDEVSLTPAEFSLFFEGASLEKRFIDSPSESKRFLRARKNSTCESAALA
jgi:transposase